MTETVVKFPESIGPSPNSINNEPEKAVIHEQIIKNQIDEAIQDYRRTTQRNMLLGGFIVVVTVICIVLGFRFGIIPGKGEDIIDELRKSNKEITDALIASASQNITGTVQLDQEELVSTFRDYNAKNQAALDTLETMQSKPDSALQDILLGLLGAIVLGVAGVLGLQRLGSIDQEITSLRDSLRIQIKDGSEDNQNILRAYVYEQVEKLEDELQKLMEDTQARVERSLTSFQTSKDTVINQLEGRAGQIEERIAGVETLLAQYHWLTVESDFKELSGVIQVTSVEQAHRLADRFHETGDSVSARKALALIVERDLPGSRNNFFNSCMQAFRQNEYVLAYEIAHKGHGRYPSDWDLAATLTRAMTISRSVEEACEFMAGWKQIYPEGYWRNWRPVVFYTDALQELPHTPDLEQQIINELDAGVEKLPHEIKVWANYGDYLKTLGRIDEAIEVVRHAVQANPLSQQLVYQLGELLLSRGEKECIIYLERAVSIDFQEQYQSDIGRFAVLATLGQAYEAFGQPQKAFRTYKTVLEIQPVTAQEKDAKGTISVYIHQRLSMLSVLYGDLGEADTLDSAVHTFVDLNVVASLLVQALRESDEEKKGRVRQLLTHYKQHPDPDYHALADAWREILDCNLDLEEQIGKLYPNFQEPTRGIIKAVQDYCDK
ncbi:tetratricopeptide repeat protein [Aggregatilinea lenta]|uniref:tetratricopeptide repeat protein n=1 Tax=Aggregatilinea lenta TaxID=913108 RepID=UPI0013C2DDF4|nr:tetratricopeptide repeat protein [Aggregatilinea lenta]